MDQTMDIPWRFAVDWMPANFVIGEQTNGDMKFSKYEIGKKIFFELKLVCRRMDMYIVSVIKKKK